MIALVTICLLVLVGCMAACIFHLARGPHAIDRVLAFDLVAVLLAAALAVYAILSGSWLYVEISMGLAVLGLVGTVAFAHFVRGEGVF